jgi:drug/metabolite transporter (DMT)-like permease
VSVLAKSLPLVYHASVYPEVFALSETTPQATMLRGALYGLTAAAIWGGMYVVSDVVLEVIPPFTLLALRLVLGLAVLLPVFQRLGLTQPGRSQYRQVLGVGIIGFGISLGAQFVGTDLSNAVNGSLITSASPAFIVLFAVLILRERLTVRRVLAVTVATVGVLVILDPTEADFGSETFTGDLALAIAALTWGLYSVLVRRVTHKHNLDTLVVTSGAFSGGLLFTIPASAVELTQTTIGEIDLGIVLGVLYLGIVSTAVAMWLWNRAFALVDASVASLFFFAQPFTGVLLGVLLLDQPMTAGLWIGGLLIGAGVLLSLGRE